MVNKDFLITLRHKDGSIVTFSPRGWSSTDLQQAAWLNAMNHLTSSASYLACCPNVA